MMRLTYAGRAILTDPFLSARHANPAPFDRHGPYPTVELP
jgi:hypothetical protein